MTKKHKTKHRLPKAIDLDSQDHKTTFRRPDCLKGHIVIREDFDTLPPDILAAFKGENP